MPRSRPAVYAAPKIRGFKLTHYPWSPQFCRYFSSVHEEGDMDEPGGGLDTWHRIEILMQEYRTLREEIASRVNARFAIVGYLGAVGTYVLVETDASDSLILPLVIWDLSVGAKQVLPLAVLLLLALWLRLGQLIRRCSLRIAEIEDKVNHLAGGELLVWESRNKQHGLFHKLFRVLEKTTAQPKRRT